MQTALTYVPPSDICVQVASGKGGLWHYICFTARPCSISLESSRIGSYPGSDTSEALSSHNKGPPRSIAQLCGGLHDKQST